MSPGALYRYKAVSVFLYGAMSRIVQCFSVFFHRSTYVRLCTYVHSRFWGVLLPCPLPMSRFVQSFSIRKFSGCTTYNVHSRCWGVLLPCPLPMSRFVQSFSGRCDSWYTTYNIRICPIHSACNLHAQYNHVRTASADCHAAAAYTVSTSALSLTRQSADVLPVASRFCS